MIGVYNETWPLQLGNSQILTEKSILKDIWDALLISFMEDLPEDFPNFKSIKRLRIEFPNNCSVQALETKLEGQETENAVNISERYCVE